jgi:hypothetical protein
MVFPVLQPKAHNFGGAGAIMRSSLAPTLYPTWIYLSKMTKNEIDEYFLYFLLQHFLLFMSIFAVQNQMNKKL